MGMQPKHEGGEERKHPRTHLGVKGTVLYPDGRSVPVMVQDLSYGGARLEMKVSREARPLAGKSINLEIPVLAERSRGPLSPFRASVVWTKPRPDGTLSVGIRFSQGSSATLRLLIPALPDLSL